MVGDDFNRLYERLVLRGTSLKKREQQAILEVAKAADSDAETLDQASRVATDLESIRRQEQQEHDAEVTSTVKRLRLTRNLRGFAQLMHCSPHRLAMYLVDASVKDERRFLKAHEKAKRQRTRHKERYAESKVDRRLRLETIAARLFLRRADAFQPHTATTLEGRHRVIDELLFFSPPRVMSRIGYAERGNVVCVAPRRLHSQKPRLMTNRVSVAPAKPSLEKANP